MRLRIWITLVVMIVCGLVVMVSPPRALYIPRIPIEEAPVQTIYVRVWKDGTVVEGQLDDEGGLNIGNFNAGDSIGIQVFVSGTTELPCPPETKCDSNKGCINTSTGNVIEICNLSDPNCESTIPTDKQHLCMFVGFQWAGCKNDTHYKCEGLPYPNKEVTVFSVTDKNEIAKTVDCGSFTCVGFKGCGEKKELINPPSGVGGGNGWVNVSDVMASDDRRAYTSSDGSTQEYTLFNFNLLPSYTIEKVYLIIESYTDNIENSSLSVRVMKGGIWNSYQVPKRSSEGSDIIDITGSGWGVDEVNNIAVRLEYTYSGSGSGTYYVDYIAIKVEYTVFHTCSEYFGPHYRTYDCNYSSNTLGCIALVQNGTTDQNGYFGFTSDIPSSPQGGRVIVTLIGPEAGCPPDYVWEGTTDCMWHWEAWGYEKSWALCDYDSSKLLGDKATIYKYSHEECCKFWFFGRCLIPGVKLNKCAKDCIQNNQRCIKYFGCKEYPSGACYPKNCDQVPWYFDSSDCYSAWLSGYSVGETCYYGGAMTRCKWEWIPPNPWVWDGVIYPCAYKTTQVKMIVPKDNDAAIRGDMGICLVGFTFRDPEAKLFCDCAVSSSTFGKSCGQNRVCQGYDFASRSTCANNLRCGAEVYRCNIPWWCCPSVESNGGGWVVSRCGEFRTQGNSYALISLCQGKGIKGVGIPLLQWSWRVGDCWYWSGTCFGGCTGGGNLLTGCDTAHNLGTHCVCRDCSNSCYGYTTGSAPNLAEITLYQKNFTYGIPKETYDFISVLCQLLSWNPLYSWMCGILGQAGIGWCDGDDPQKFINLIESGCFYGENCWDPYSIPKFTRTIRDQSGRAVCICDSTKKIGGEFPKDCGNSGDGNGVCVNEQLGIIVKDVTCSPSGFVGNFTDATITQFFVINKIGAYCGYRNCIKKNREALACQFFSGPSGCPSFDNSSDVFSLVITVKNTGGTNLTNGFLLFGTDGINLNSFSGYRNDLNPSTRMSVEENGRFKEEIYDLRKLRQRSGWEEVLGFILCREGENKTLRSQNVYKIRESKRFDLVLEPGEEATYLLVLQVSGELAWNLRRLKIFFWDESVSLLRPNDPLSLGTPNDYFTSAWISYGIESSLVGFWGFDEGAPLACKLVSHNSHQLYAPQINDHSGYENHGVLYVYGAYQADGKCHIDHIQPYPWVGGVVGYGIQIAPLLSDSGILVENSPTLNPREGITLQTWVFGARGRIVDKRGQYSLEIIPQNSEARVKFSIVIGGNTYSLTSNHSIKLGEWNLITVTWNWSEGMMKIYINDQLDAQSATPSSPLATSSNPLKIGESSQGIIDELKIYNRSLSSEEVRDAYYQRGVWNLLPISVVELKFSEVRIKEKLSGLDIDPSVLRVVGTINFTRNMNEESLSCTNCLACIATTSSSTSDLVAWVNSPLEFNVQLPEFGVNKLHKYVGLISLSRSRNLHLYADLREKKGESGAYFNYKVDETKEVNKFTWGIKLGEAINRNVAQSFTHNFLLEIFNKTKYEINEIPLTFETNVSLLLHTFFTPLTFSVVAGNETQVPLANCTFSLEISGIKYTFTTDESGIARISRGSIPPINKYELVLFSVENCKRDGNDIKNLTVTVYNTSNAEIIIYGDKSTGICRYDVSLPPDAICNDTTCFCYVPFTILSINGTNESLGGRCYLNFSESPGGMGIAVRLVEKVRRIPVPNYVVVVYDPHSNKWYKNVSDENGSLIVNLSHLNYIDVYAYLYNLEGYPISVSRILENERISLSMMGNSLEINFKLNGKEFNGNVSILNGTDLSQQIASGLISNGRASLYLIDWDYPLVLKISDPSSDYVYYHSFLVNGTNKVVYNNFSIGLSMIPDATFSLAREMVVEENLGFDRVNQPFTFKFEYEPLTVADCREIRIFENYTVQINDGTGISNVLVELPYQVIQDDKATSTCELLMLLNLSRNSNKSFLILYANPYPKDYPADWGIINETEWSISNNLAKIVYSKDCRELTGACIEQFSMNGMNYASALLWDATKTIEGSHEFKASVDGSIMKCAQIKYDVFDILMVQVPATTLVRREKVTHRVVRETCMFKDNTIVLEEFKVYVIGPYSINLSLRNSAAREFGEIMIDGNVFTHDTQFSGKTKEITYFSPTLRKVLGFIISREISNISVKFDNNVFRAANPYISNLYFSQGKRFDQDYALIPDYVKLQDVNDINIINLDFTQIRAIDLYNLENNGSAIFYSFHFISSGTEKNCGLDTAETEEDYVVGETCGYGLLRISGGLMRPGAHLVEFVAPTNLTDAAGIFPVEVRDELGSSLLDTSKYLTKCNVINNRFDCQVLYDEFGRRVDISKNGYMVQCIFYRSFGSFDLGRTFYAYYQAWIYPLEWEIKFDIIVNPFIELPIPVRIYEGNDQLRSILFEEEHGLQVWMRDHGFEVNVFDDELGIELFPAGKATLTLLNGHHGYPDPVGWYSGGFRSSTITQLGESLSIDSAQPFGVFLISEDLCSYGKCIFYTEIGRNEDGVDHAWIYKVKEIPLTYLIAFEDLKGGGDGDYEDRVILLEYSELY